VLTASVSNVLEGYSWNNPLIVSHYRATFDMTAHTVTTPDPSSYVTPAQITKALFAATLPATVRAHADNLARNVDYFARKAHRRSAVAADLVSATRAEQTAIRKCQAPVTLTAMVNAAGAVVSATNPYTGTVTAYRVGITHGRAVIH
jgi:hypothetical protein